MGRHCQPIVSRLCPGTEKEERGAAYIDNASTTVDTSFSADVTDGPTTGTIARAPAADCLTVPRRVVWAVVKEWNASIVTSSLRADIWPVGGSAELAAVMVVAM